MSYDVLIKNGRVVDGSGLPSFIGDVAVKDGKIAEMGKLSGPAKRTIDAHNRAIAPGFIDNHCHYDAQVTWDPLCTFSCYHGATTVIFGNCSLALAPVRQGDEDALVSMLSRVEAIPMDVLQAGIQWGWESFGDYMNALEGKLGVNVGALMGHSAIRRYVMGEAGYERDATDDELKAMQQVVRTGLEDGALGLSFNRNRGHFDHSGRPLPAVVAPFEELYALAEAMGDVGTGVIQSGASGPLEMDQGYCSKLSDLSGRPVVYNQIVHRWTMPGHWQRHLDHVKETVRQGSRAYPLLNPRPVNQTFTMKNCQVFDRLPAWKPIMVGSVADKIAAFQDMELRQQLRAEAVDRSGVPQDSISIQWDRAWVVEPALEKNAGLKGRSIADIAGETGKNVLDALLDLALEEDMETVFEMNLLGGDEDAMAELLNSPYPIIGLSDAGAHVVFDAGYGYSTHLLGHWVRDKSVLSLEDAVHKLTFAPATVFGLNDRGLIRPGYAADLVVFDPDTVAPEEPTEVFDLPGGGMRLAQKARGVDYTIVNGEVLIAEGEHTGALPGEVARNSMYGKSG